jgi:excinuclease UvrABC nuclease subunit
MRDYNFERYSELRDIITRKVENDIPNLIVIDGGKE